MAHLSQDTSKTEQYSASDGWDGSEQLVFTLVSAVADYTGRDALDLPPLYEVIDPDAFEQLFKPLQENGTRANGGRIRFTYAGCDISISNSEITVQSTGEASVAE